MNLNQRRPTRGLSNLEVKLVGKLAFVGTLLKAVKTSCAPTMQGRTYLIKCRLSLHTYCKIARVLELQLNIHVERLKLSVLGSHWTLLPKISVISSPSTLAKKNNNNNNHHHPEVDVDVGLPAGKLCMHSRTFSLCASLQAFLTAFHSRL